MENLAKSFVSLWHPVLSATNLPFDWPAPFIAHAENHPTIVRPGRHRKPAQTVEGAIESESEDSDEDGEDSDGLFEDDADVSPYR
jgi:hypothetical protein